MGCSWFLNFGHLEIDSGNQNCTLEFLQLLQGSDFESRPVPRCSVPAKELHRRLVLLGYSATSCEAFLDKYLKELEENKKSILFFTEDFRYENPWESLSAYLRTVTVGSVAAIWKKLFQGQPLETNDRYLFLLVTNNFESEYIDPYFDQNIVYFLLSEMSPDSDFVLEMGELFDWGYWSNADFEVNAFEQQLAVTSHEEVLIRHSILPIEEDGKNEFKEVTERSVLNSIKSNLEKYAIGFLNANGGSLFFGITNSGVVLGFQTDRRKRDDIVNLAVSILNNVRPKVPPQCYKIEFLPLLENAEIIRDLVCLRVSFESRKGGNAFVSSNGRSWFRQYGATVELVDFDGEKT